LSFPVPEGAVLFDGRWVAPGEASLPLADPSVQSGLGVFETLAVREGRVLDLDDHVTRLGASAARLGVPLPEREVLAAACLGYAAHAGAGTGWMKILAVRGGHWAVFGGAMSPEDEGRPATAIVLPWARSVADPLGGVKSTSYAPFALGLEEARSQGADEGLWRNSRGHLLEGCASNLFLASGRALFTASPREGILAGTTRAHVLDAARAMGLSIHEGRVRMERLFRAEEAFLSSSLRGVRALLAVDGRPIGRGVPGPIVAEIAGRVAQARRASARAPEIPVPEAER
jgi:branched-subunit amino acid aminotransferase/4-amino-4-deoxychorismate lyase